MAGHLGLVALGLLGITLGLLGCDSGSIGGSGQCGGASDANACVQIDTIQPVYLGQTTSNVDALRDNCATATSTTSTPEPFTDHNATITITNAPLPGVGPGVGPTAETTVTLQDFSIRYTLNACPAGATCPALDTLAAAPVSTVTIPARGSVTITLPFVPLAKKFEYAIVGSLSAFPSYTATYTITGTDTFHNTVSVRGSAQFTIGDFDNCPR